MTNSIPLEECVALAHRVSGGDPKYVAWVLSDPAGKTIGRHFDNVTALAECLAREMEAEFRRRNATLAKPGDRRRFQHLFEGFEAWLSSPHHHHILNDRNDDKVFARRALVKYLEGRFHKERGAIRREEIEQINLAFGRRSSSREWRRCGRKRVVDCGSQ
jgi:hypothetical protein